VRCRFVDWCAVALLIGALSLAKEERCLVYPFGDEFGESFNLFKVIAVVLCS